MYFSTFSLSALVWIVLMIILWNSLVYFFIVFCLPQLLKLLQLLDNLYSMGMNWPFNLITILSHFIFHSFPLQFLSNCTSFQQMVVCPLSLVLANFTCFGSSISLNLKYSSISFIESINSFRFRLQHN